ncbi:MAG TPA: hypothetical protein VH186_15805 [Chloroflexia bacterium]|nr:hypothetical protein [Chloroflexia bacterium]
MKLTGFYLITAKPKLLELLEHYSYDVKEYFGPSRLWLKTVDSHALSSFTNEVPVMLKLLFLTQLQVVLEKGVGEQREFGELAHFLLKEPPYSVSVFDEWWNITYLDGLDNEVESLEKITKVEYLQELAPTDNPDANDWLSRLIKSKLEK